MRSRRPAMSIGDTEGIGGTVSDRRQVHVMTLCGPPPIMRASLRVIHLERGQDSLKV
jgi:hypothetical protein